MSDFYDVPTRQLAEMIAHNAASLAQADPKLLEGVRDDLLEAADLVIPAAEFVEEQREVRAEAQGVVFRAA